MADISRLSRLLNGVLRGVDLTSNTLVVQSIKIGAGETELTQAILDNLVSLQDGSEVAGTLHTHNDIYYTETELGSTSNGLGASLIGIEDAATQFTATNVEGALTEALDAAQAAQADATQALSDAEAAQDGVDALVALSGVAALAENLGSFSGTVIPDNQTIKQAFQALETYSEANRSLIQNFEWQESVLDIVLDSDDIVGPSTGDRYLIAGTGVNDFSGQDNDIAEWDGAAWVFTTPTIGTYVAVDDENNGLYLFGGSSWDKKFFEATTASVGLTKVGFDIRLADAALANGVEISSGAISVGLGTDSGLAFETGAGLIIDFGTSGVKAVTAANLASNSNGLGASLIGIEDSGAVFTATTVEGALAELEGRVDTLEGQPTDSIVELMPAGETLDEDALVAVRMAKSGDAGFTAGRVYKADQDASGSDDFYVVGLAIPSVEASAGDNVSVVKIGKMTVTGHGFTAGTPIFLGTSGALTATAPTADDTAVVRVGIARDANTIEVQIQVMGVN